VMILGYLFHVLFDPACPRELVCHAHSTALMPPS